MTFAMVKVLPESLHKLLNRLRLIAGRLIFGMKFEDILLFYNSV